jgi:hypothetical protein
MRCFLLHAHLRRNSGAQGGSSSCSSNPSVAPLVLALHLRMQQSMMMRLVHHLALEVG